MENPEDEKPRHVLRVLSFLLPFVSAKDLARCSLVSRSWKLLASDEHLWRALTEARWPSAATLEGSEAVKNMGGHQRFYSRRVVLRLQRPHPTPGLALEALFFHVDVYFKDQPLVSKAGTAAKMVPPCSLASPRVRCVVSIDVAKHFGVDPLPVLYHPRALDSYLRDIHVSWLASRQTDNKMVLLLDASCTIHGYQACRAGRHLVRVWQTVPVGPTVSLTWYALLHLDRATQADSSQFCLTTLELGLEVSYGQETVGGSVDDILRWLSILEWK
eukprot:jgi/Mesen1/9071/ME000578S08306